MKFRDKAIGIFGLVALAYTLFAPISSQASLIGDTVQGRVNLSTLGLLNLFQTPLPLSDAYVSKVVTDPTTEFRSASLVSLSPNLRRLSLYANFSGDLVTLKACNDRTASDDQDDDGHPGGIGAGMGISPSTFDFASLNWNPPGLITGFDQIAGTWVPSSLTFTQTTLLVSFPALSLPNNTCIAATFRIRCDVPEPVIYVTLSCLLILGVMINRYRLKKAYQSLA